MYFFNKLPQTAIVTLILSRLRDLTRNHLGLEVSAPQCCIRKTCSLPMGPRIPSGTPATSQDTLGLLQKVCHSLESFLLPTARQFPLRPICSHQLRPSSQPFAADSSGRLTLISHLSQSTLATLKSLRTWVLLPTSHTTVLMP